MSQTISKSKALAGTGKNAAAIFNEPLSPEATPSADNRVLQVALLWGDTLINVKEFGDGVPVTVGENASNSFNVFSSGVGSSFALALSSGSKITVNLPVEAGVVLSSSSGAPRAKAELKAEGRLSAAEGSVRADSLQLGLHDRAQISLDTVSFIVRYVRPSAAVARARFDEGDFSFFKIASICLMAFFALLAAWFVSPLMDDGYSDDIFSNPSKYVNILVKAEKKLEVKKLELSGAKEGAKAKDPEGKFGKKDVKKDQADPSKKGTPIVDAKKREEDRKKVLSAGLLGAMGGGAASSVMGPGGLGTGVNDALGGLKGGAGMGEAGGVGGLGSRGNGQGGGGTGLGMGGLGTVGSGGGRGGRGFDLGGTGKQGTRVIPGTLSFVGGLSKDVISRVIRQHQNEIKFCFEQELQKTPDLAGKVAVAFVIDAAGAVSEAKVSDTSLNNANAENCMLSSIRRWKFPEPEGGTLVTVNYPWIFKAAGSEE